MYFIIILFIVVFMNHLAINICLLTAGFFGGIFAAPHRSGEPALAAPPDYYLGTEFTYVKAIDGDTLDITDPRGNITRIRLHAIDTPERQSAVGPISHRPAKP